MPKPSTPNIATRALPLRAVELCRAAVAVIAAILSIGALVLLVTGVVILRGTQPSFGQLPAAPAADNGRGIVGQVGNASNRPANLTDSATIFDTREPATGAN